MGMKNKPKHEPVNSMYTLSLWFRKGFPTGKCSASGDDFDILCSSEPTMRQEGGTSWMSRS